MIKPTLDKFTCCVSKPCAAREKLLFNHVRIAISLRNLWAAGGPTRQVAEGEFRNEWRSRRPNSYFTNSCVKQGARVN